MVPVLFKNHFHVFSIFFITFIFRPQNVAKSCLLVANVASALTRVIKRKRTGVSQAHSVATVKI